MMYVRMVYTSKSKKVLFQFKKKNTPVIFELYYNKSFRGSSNLGVLIMNLADTSTHINFYFTSELSFTNIDDSQDSKGRSEDISLSPLYHFHLLHRHLEISWMATGESSPVHIASSRISTENLSIPIQLTCLWERGWG